MRIAKLMLCKEDVHVFCLYAHDTGICQTNLLYAFKYHLNNNNYLHQIKIKNPSQTTEKNPTRSFLKTLQCIGDTFTLH